MVEQKSRVEVRNRIRREFEAMVRREREMRQKAARQVRDARQYYSVLFSLDFVNLNYQHVTGQTHC